MQYTIAKSAASKTKEKESVRDTEKDAQHVQHQDGAGRVARRRRRRQQLPVAGEHVHNVEQLNDPPQCVRDEHQMRAGGSIAADAEWQWESSGARDSQLRDESPQSQQSHQS